MAARRDLDGLLPQLHRILSDESQGKQEKLVFLRKKCEGIICEERNRVMGSPDHDLSVRSCEFSRIQFPNSQKSRSGNRRPVRLVEVNIIYVFMREFM